MKMALGPRHAGTPGGPSYAMNRRRAAYSVRHAGGRQRGVGMFLFLGIYWVATGFLRVVEGVVGRVQILGL